MMVTQTLATLDTQGVHVYVIYGDRVQNENEVRDFLSKIKKIEIHQNPDVFFFSSPQFSITQSRKVKELVSVTNTVLDRKYITISTDALTVESQNALLKTIEDPYSPTVFFILVPEGSFILETITSRAQIIKQKAGDQYQIEVKKFLNVSFKERLEMLDMFYTVGDEKKPQLNKGQAMLFFNTVEKELSRQVLQSKILPDVFDDVSEVYQYLLDRSANSKQILEYICLRIPKI